MNFKTKGMNGVVATALFLVVAVVSVISFQNFYNNYQSGLFADTETKSGATSNSGIQNVVAGDLYFKNGESENLTISQITLGGVDCNQTTNVTPDEMAKIDITACRNNLTTAKAELVVYTNKRVYSKYFYFKEYANAVSSSGSGSFEGGGGSSGNLSYNFTTTPDCSFNASYTKLLGFFSQNNSHVSLAGQTGVPYSLCVYHKDYNLGTSCSGNYVRLFYLGANNNSHIYIDNSTANPLGTYSWTEVCLSSDGALDLKYNSSDMSAQGYSEIISYAQDDVNGGIVGVLNPLQNINRIWVKFG